MPLRVSFQTLGCKLNQLETESIADAFARSGADVLPLDTEEGIADLFVVNTCTVTSKADQKARRIVRRALAASPSAAALVTGCYAQLEADTISALGERVVVLPGSAKEALLGLPAWLRVHGQGEQGLTEALREWLAETSTAAAGGSRPGPFSYKPEAFAFHSRPALKIQDGCDGACAYCRVRIARGPSVSLSASEILARARELEAAGRAEIVLTGVNLSRYRDGDLDFPSLLKLLIAGTERIAFRLSSYEVDRVDAAFLDAFADPRVRPHVHLAVQSGSDAVLSRMGRNYHASAIAAAVASLRRVRHDPFIAADLICGFPGETDDEAAATFELARSCDFAWIHAFHFSARPATKAASMSGRVPDRVAGERVDGLLGLATAGRSAYIDRWGGSEVHAVLESARSRGATGATSENYIKLKILGLPQNTPSGRAIYCRIDKGPKRPAQGEGDRFALYIRSGE